MQTFVRTQNLLKVANLLIQFMLHSVTFTTVLTNIFLKRKNKHYRQQYSLCNKQLTLGWILYTSVNNRTKTRTSNDCYNKWVPFIMHDNTRTLLHRKPTFTRTSHNICHVWGHDNRDNWWRNLTYILTVDLAFGCRKRKMKSGEWIGHYDLSVMKW